MLMKTAVLSQLFSKFSRKFLLSYPLKSIFPLSGDTRIQEFPASFKDYYFWVEHCCHDLVTNLLQHEMSFCNHLLQLIHFVRKCFRENRVHINLFFKKNLKNVKHNIVRGKRRTWFNAKSWHYLKCFYLINVFRRLTWSLKSASGFSVLVRNSLNLRSCFDGFLIFSTFAVFFLQLCISC